MVKFPITCKKCGKIISKGLSVQGSKIKVIGTSLTFWLCDDCDKEFKRFISNGYRF